MRYGSVFSIPVEGFSAEKTIQHIHRAGEPIWIVTANPEILLYAQQHPEYAKTIAAASVRLVDGVGLWALLRLKGKKTSRVTGVELAEHLLQYATQHHLRVMLIGGGEGIAQRAAEKTREAYPDLQLFFEQGGTANADGSDDLAGVAARSRIQAIAPDIILVGFGHPKQEMWIAKHLCEFPTVRAIVGVGGTFDFWAGEKKRAPAFMRAFGLEWLWRLMIEPARWKRIWNAVVVFPITAICAKENPPHSEGHET